MCQRLNFCQYANLNALKLPLNAAQKFKIKEK